MSVVRHVTSMAGQPVLRTGHWTVLVLHCNTDTAYRARSQRDPRHLPHLEPGECSVGRLVEVREGEAVCLVLAQSFHPAQHPVVVLALLLVRHVLGRPGRVPAVPLLVLPTAHCWVRLNNKLLLPTIYQS